MQFARELLCEVVQEVQPLLELHYRELCLHRDVIKLDPRWETYAALEQAGAFVVLTAREGEELIGYNAFFFNRHMHYGGFTVAQNDVLFLHPAFRRGTTALRFLDFSEQQMRELDADKISYHIKFSMDWRPILHRRGYCDEEVMCAKLLKGA
jgi:hypothetical protein